MSSTVEGLFAEVWEEKRVKLGRVGGVGWFGGLFGVEGLGVFRRLGYFFLGFFFDCIGIAREQYNI